MTLDEIIDKICAQQAILDSFQVEDLRLFGSYARGVENHDSDLDVLVRFQGPPTFDHYMNLKFFLEKLLELRVDLVTDGALRPELKQQIYNEAVHVT